MKIKKESLHVNLTDFVVSVKANAAVEFMDKFEDAFIDYLMENYPNGQKDMSEDIKEMTNLIISLLNAAKLAGIVALNDIPDIPDFNMEGIKFMIPGDNLIFEEE